MHDRLRPAIHRRLFAWAGLLLALVAACASHAKEKITFAYQVDPVFEAVLWGIKNNKVTSDVIDVEAIPLAIPALIQATLTKRYDVVQTDTIGVPRSAERGLELRILSTAIRYRPEGDAQILFVPKSSVVKTVNDLKGKKIAVSSLGSTGFHNLRFALGEVSGLNVDVMGGDFSWVELPPAAMYSALSQNRVDAASMSLTHTYRAKMSGEFRPAIFAGKILFDRFKVQMISSVNVSYPEKLDARPQAYREFNRLLKASADYMRTHSADVYASVGKSYNVDPQILRGLQLTLAEFPAELEQKDLAALAKEWELAKKYGLLKATPNVSHFVWSGVVIQK